MHMSSLIAADTRYVHYGAFVLKAKKNMNTYSYYSLYTTNIAKKSRVRISDSKTLTTRI